MGQVNLSCVIFRNASDRKDDDTKERRDNTSNIGREILQTFVFKTLLGLRSCRKRSISLGNLMEVVVSLTESDIVMNRSGTDLCN